MTGADVLKAPPPSGGRLGGRPRAEELAGTPAPPPNPPPGGEGFQYRRAFSQADFDRFARLTGDDNPIHCNPAFARKSHFGATVSHGMLLYACISKAFTDFAATRHPRGGGDPGLPGVLQLGQELMFPNPTFVGEEVTIALEPIATHADGTFELRTTVTKAEGLVSAQGRAHLAPAGVRPVVPVRAAQPVSGDRELYGLRPGMSATTHRTFHDGDLEEYVDLVGDRNPLFHDDTVARAAGFARRLVPPALLAGMFSDLFGTRLPGRGTGWMKQQMVFPAPAYVDAALSASVAITRVRADKELVNLQSWIADEFGRLVCAGESLVLVRNLEDKRSAFARTAG